jgi:hypothetical protein
VWWGEEEGAGEEGVWVSGHPPHPFWLTHTHTHTKRKRIKKEKKERGEIRSRRKNRKEDKKK